ncbi:MAG TPA: ROK family protein [Candidatus Angelobacter sp.]
MNVLAIDVGGTNVKILVSGQADPRKFPSGRTLTPARMVSQVKKLAADWEYDVVSIGYPGRVHHGRPTTEPRNLAKGWMGFNFAGAFKRPVKIMNDAAMQALGSYKGGLMLFIGLGTGLGSAIIEEQVVVPLELGQVPYKNGTYETHLGAGGLKRFGKKKWQKQVADGVGRIIAAFQPDDVVIGGGNVKKLRTLPPGSRAGHNAFAFLGGFRLWEPAQEAGLRRPSAKSRLKVVAGNRRKPRERSAPSARSA